MLLFLKFEYNTDWKRRSETFAVYRGQAQRLMVYIKQIIKLVSMAVHLYNPRIYRMRQEDCDFKANIS